MYRGVPIFVGLLKNLVRDWDVGLVFGSFIELESVNILVVDMWIMFKKVI
jgi:hypothetical protein